MTPPHCIPFFLYSAANAAAGPVPIDLPKKMIDFGSTPSDIRKLNVALTRQFINSPFATGTSGRTPYPGYSTARMDTLSSWLISRNSGFTCPISHELPDVECSKLRGDTYRVDIS
ncbi:transcriptional regulator, putative [Babesia ovis]|uniref:Transcriptional regulator, putative n=1 Tax=Babesia ovis TaxID=5869 RepID=A0A9W5T8N9_BABOV|nr:transcriptional regulator, putative [Babesia ovis]